MQIKRDRANTSNKKDKLKAKLLKKNSPQEEMIQIKKMNSQGSNRSKNTRLKRSSSKGSKSSNSSGRSRRAKRSRKKTKEIVIDQDGNETEVVKYKMTRSEW